MTITIVVTKTKLAIAVLAMAVLVPATAVAVDSWSDTPDGAFYHDAVTWARDNGMTVGCDGGTNFCPERGVTRGENITFAKRYDDLVVQPALAAIEGDVATNTADIAENTSLLSQLGEANVTDGSLRLRDLGYERPVTTRTLTSGFLIPGDTCRRIGTFNYEGAVIGSMVIASINSPGTTATVGSYVVVPNIVQDTTASGFAVVYVTVCATSASAVDIPDGSEVHFRMIGA